jgi:cytochrome c oxidase subunit 4
MAEHVTSVRTYVTIYLILMALLVLTVGLAFAPLGGFEAVPAYLIAAAKAILVVLFFMEVRVQSRLTWLIACIGFVWLGVMIVLSMNDYVTRGWSPSDEQIRPEPHAIIRPPH